MALRWSRRPKCVYREVVIDAGGRPAGIWLSRSATALSCGCHGSGWRLQDERLSVRVDLLTETDRQTDTQIPVFILGLFNDALWSTYVTTTEGEEDLPEATQRKSTLEFFEAPFQPESAQTATAGGTGLRLERGTLPNSQKRRQPFWRTISSTIHVSVRWRH